MVTSEPLDKELVCKIAANLGEITLYTAGIDFDDTLRKQKAADLCKLEFSLARLKQTNIDFSANNSKNGIVVNSAGTKRPPRRPGQHVLRPTFTVGALAVARPLGSRDHVRHAASGCRLEER